MPTLALHAAFLATCLSLSSPAPARTWIVDAAGGAGSDFRAIQAAVDAAVDGDAILIRSGTYVETVLIDGKGLTISGLGGFLLVPPAISAANPAVFEVRNLPAGREAHFRGFGVLRLSGVSGDAFVLRDNTGRVWCEELSLDSYDGPALRIDGCAEVLLRNVFAQSNAAILDASGVPSPAPGAVIERSLHVELSGGEVRGSHGPPLRFTPTAPIEGGTGLVVRDAAVALSSCQLQGGPGGSVLVGSCRSAARGGSGLIVGAPRGRTTEVTTRAVRITAGRSGARDPLCAADPGQAPAIDDPQGFVRALAGLPRRLLWPTRTDLEGNFQHEIQGAPFDLVLALVSLDTQVAQRFAEIDGALWIPLASSFVAFTGRLDENGRARASARFVAPGEPIHLRAQVLLLDTTGALWLSNPGTILLR
ncbi:MAG: hypothetical protein JNM84_15960 [Planctomycetes bacterium]|nr:hypothetical protein [Planctomycetota bacterium]